MREEQVVNHYGETVTQRTTSYPDGDKVSHIRDRREVGVVYYFRAARGRRAGWAAINGLKELHEPKPIRRTAAEAMKDAY